MFDRVPNTPLRLMFYYIDTIHFILIQHHKNLTATPFQSYLCFNTFIQEFFPKVLNAEKRSVTLKFQKGCSRRATRCIYKLNKQNSVLYKKSVY